MKARLIVLQDGGIDPSEVALCLTCMGLVIDPSVGRQIDPVTTTAVPGLFLREFNLADDGEGARAAARIQTRLGRPAAYLCLGLASGDDNASAADETGRALVVPFDRADLFSVLAASSRKQSTRAGAESADPGGAACCPGGELPVEETDYAGKEPPAAGAGVADPTWSREWLSTTLQSISDAVIATDAKGLITFMNPMAEELLGSTALDAAGLSFDQVCRLSSCDTDGQEEDILSLVRETGVAVRLAPHTRLRGREGQSVPIDGSAAPIMAGGDRVGGAVLVFHDITDRQRAEDALRESEERYRTLVELSPNAIAVHSGGTLRFANTAAARLFRVEDPQQLIGLPVLELVHPDYHDLAVRRIREMTEQRKRVPGVEEIFVARDGTLLDVEVTAAAILMGGEPAVMVVARDIKERKRAEDALRRSEESFRILTENMLDVITQTDPDGLIVFQSPSVRNVLGYDPEALLRTSFFALCHPDDRTILSSEFKKSIASATPSKLEHRCRHAAGAYFWMETVGNPLLDKGGSVIGAVLSSRDITSRKQMEERLKFLSLNDRLTGLYNRAYFEQEMLRLDGGRSRPVGAIVCDLDGLKFVNDSLGHEKGDALLVAAAEVFQRTFRAGDMIARIGGDEFAIFLPRTGRREVRRAVGRIRKAIAAHNESFPDLPLSVSIGFAVGEDDSASMGDLVRLADNNMYREKLSSNRSTRNAILSVIFHALKARDVRTEEHAERLQTLVTSMARSLSLPEDTVSELQLLARFHDIGKVGIPEAILTKAAPLTEDEHREMQRHCEIGYRIAQAAPDLASIAERILRHHEWWNGAGYPGRLRGEEIPLESRILAIADAYDAMTSDRPYRGALSPEGAVQEIRRCSGTQFDPNLTEVFLGTLGRLAD